MAVNYSSVHEKDARDFVKKLTGNDLPTGPDNIQRALKDGRILAE